MYIIRSIAALVMVIIILSSILSIEMKGKGTMEKMTKSLETVNNENDYLINSGKEIRVSGKIVLNSLKTLSDKEVILLKDSRTDTNKKDLYVENGVAIIYPQYSVPNQVLLSYPEANDYGEVTEIRYEDLFNKDLNININKDSTYIKKSFVGTDYKTLYHYYREE